MKWVEIKFYVLADSEDEATALNKDLYGFVSEKANKGIAVSAKSLISALNKFKDSKFIDMYLKYGK